MHTIMTRHLGCASKHISKRVSLECVRCSDMAESVDHALFHCTDSYFLLLWNNSVCDNVGLSLAKTLFISLYLNGEMGDANKKDVRNDLSFFHQFTDFKFKSRWKELFSSDFSERWVNIAPLCS